MFDKNLALAPQSLPTATVSVPQWGGDATVTALSALDSERMQQGWRNLDRPKGDFSGFGPWVVCHTVVDESGKRVFDPAKDFDTLCGKPASIVAKLFDAACKLNALTKSDQEELAKN